MEEKLISLETIKLARDKGFNWESKSSIKITWSQDKDAITKKPYEPECYLNGNDYNYNYDKDRFKELFKDESAYSVDIQILTQSHLQELIWKKYKIWIEVGFLDTKGFYVNVYTTKGVRCICRFTEYGLDPHQLKEKGLHEALLLIN